MLLLLSEGEFKSLSGALLSTGSSEERPFVETQIRLQKSEKTAERMGDHPS
jgi:hypothetical protein